MAMSGNFWKKSKWIHSMDNETAEKFSALEAMIADLKAQLAMIAPKSSGRVIVLKQVAPDLGISVETLRRRILHDPAWRKQGGRWVKRA
jgi:hypothetical protein